MKKYIFLFFIFCLQVLPAKAQWVTIPDTNFVNFLTLNYPSCMNGNLMDTTCSQIANEDSLSINIMLPISIVGIEYFNKLKYLNCQSNGNLIMSQLPDSLVILICGNNHLTSLPVLPNTLKTLKCEVNNLIFLPALPPKLEYLSCNQNNLTNLPTIPDSLEFLLCFNNDLNSIPTLPNVLKSLKCGNNNLTSLPVLPDSLEVLDFDLNSVAILPPLPGLLQYIDFGNNSISAISVLPNSLNYFNCMNNQIISLPPLPGALDTLIVSGNELTSLPLLPNTLTWLNCSSNLIAQLPILPINLTYLKCSSNMLTSLPNIPPNLTDLLCNNNQLTFLQSVPSQLESFRIDDNNISCLINLPIVNLPAFADISNNPLTCVPMQTNYTSLPVCVANDSISNPNNCSSPSNLSGHLYTDQNNNCIYNASDLGSSNIFLNLYDSINNLIAQTNTLNGNFGFIVSQPGTYKLKLQNYNSFYNMACFQADSQFVNIVSPTIGINNIDFSLDCNQADDIIVQNVHRTGWAAPGQTHLLNTIIANLEDWYNLNCNLIESSGIISIEITGPVASISPASNALIPQVNGNVLTYNISNFDSLNSESLSLNILTDTTAQAGDQICVHIEIAPTPLDADTTNNVYDFCYQVVNSYDPNMKEVYPVNVLPGYDDWFTYTIHFQNTGNAPAFNIRLRDTLDTNLDINTFEVRGYSHPAIVNLNGNNLTVRFNNIMLPDSTTNYEGSMGYFQYRIKPLPNLPLGTQIENTAYIYFDYNAPIVTNTTQNNFQTVVSTSNGIDHSNQLQVFPNPANEILNINLHNAHIENYTITNTIGQMVYNSANEINANNKIQLNISNLKVGVYFVKVLSSEGSHTSMFVKAE